MLTELEKFLKYEFKNKELIQTALSHSSYVNECKIKGMQSNERLEFLGDSVLSVITSEYLYKTYPQLPEGILTKTRAAVVCEKSLAVFAREMELGNYIMFGKGESRHNGGDRDSIISDAFEAVMAAVFLDSDIDTVKKVYMPRLSKAIDNTLKQSMNSDFKTQLQEIVQKNKQETLSYKLISESGPDHDKVFEVEVLLNNNVFSTGKGHSKKIAEQMAAKEALILMGEIDAD